MNIGVIIPDRRDRPEFLVNCLRMISKQTWQPTNILVADWEPETDQCDITWRYRKAYDQLRNKSLDCILLIENDDWYHPEYIETMVIQWMRKGYPDIFGTNYTYYYHLGTLKYKKLVHIRRASAMNTLIRPDLNIIWPKDSEPYTDLHLWKQIKGVTFDPGRIISIGMKHNVGKTGGQYHSTKLDRYSESDFSMEFLSKNLDLESFNFYKSVYEKIQNSFE